MSGAHRWLLKTARTIHVYLTLFGLALILFFGVTGFMLNHERWFSPEVPRQRTATGSLPLEMVEPREKAPARAADEPEEDDEAAEKIEPRDKLGIVERLRKEHGATGEVTGFEIKKDTLRVELIGPGRRFEAEVRRADGSMTLTYETRGLVGVLLDLHRGKNVGDGWGLLIDVTCVLLVVISATGLVLWSSLRSRGKFGALAFVLGLAGSVAVYFFCVP